MSEISLFCGRLVGAVVLEQFLKLRIGWLVKGIRSEFMCWAVSIIGAGSVARFLLTTLRFLNL